ncbi:hypothetical protein GCM10023188_26080 [Pontibacter saemangeumensis]|uniref:Uncharacterized protein n=1 Tax=Pontibacter saemangeumensis TaxID=1084525 RepID=A0ABP8LUG8_9BACT
MLEKQLFEGNPPELIKENLRANSYKILADEKFMRALTEEEVSAHRANVTESYIKIQSINEKIKEYSDHMKAERKPFEQSLEVSAFAVKTGQIEVKGDLYMIDDQENRMMGFYDATGRMVNSRPLLPEERQTNFMSITRLHRAAGDTDY